MKQILKLKESQLHRIICESVSKLLQEYNVSDVPWQGDYLERNEFFKKATYEDLPQELIDKYLLLHRGQKINWQSAYNEIEEAKNVLEKEKKRAEKAAAKRKGPGRPKNTKLKSDKRGTLLNSMAEKYPAVSKNRHNQMAKFIKAMERSKQYTINSSLFHKAYNEVLEGTDESMKNYVKNWPIYFVNCNQPVMVEVDGTTSNGWVGTCNFEGETLTVIFNGEIVPTDSPQTKEREWGVEADFNYIRVLYAKTKKPFERECDRIWTNSEISALLSKKARRVYNKMKKAQGTAEAQ